MKYCDYWLGNSCFHSLKKKKKKEKECWGLKCALLFGLTHFITLFVSIMSSVLHVVRFFASSYHQETISEYL